MILYQLAIVIIIVLNSIYCYVNLEDDLPTDALQSLEGLNMLAGGRAQRNQFPYQVSLQRYNNKKNNFYHICSGAILSNKWVVSTAYCTTPIEIRLRIVAGLLVKYEKHSDIQVVDVENIIVHPDYKSEMSENDIALLELHTFLVYTQAVQPILISKEFPAEVWGTAILSSWNVQTKLFKQLSLDILQYMIVYVMVDIDCENILRKITISSTKMVCSKKAIETFYCPGESGSPLVYDGYLIGLTSWGLKPCGTTVYTKVASFIDFIRIYVNFLD